MSRAGVISGNPGAREGLWSLPSGYRLVLAAFLALFFAVSLATLQDGHSWEFDDFGQYLAHARNLVQGRPYQEGVLLAESPADPAAYPPVYPLLLAPVWVWLGLNFVALKTVNLVMWALLTAPIFRLARRHLSRRTAFLLALFGLTIPFFFYFKQRLYSDPAFLLLALWGLVFFQDYLDRGGGGRLAGAMLMMTLAMLTRAAGVSLFAAAVLWLGLVERRWKPALLMALAPLAGAAAVLIFAAEPGLGYLGQLPDAGGWLHGSLRNVHGTLWHLFQVLAPLPLSPESGHLTPMLAVGVTVLAGLLRRFWRREVDFQVFFALVYLAMNIAWPFSATTRSMIVIGPMCAVLALEALGAGLGLAGVSRPEHRDRALQVLLLAGLIYNAVCTGLIFNYNENDTSRPETTRMLTWLQENTGPEEHYVSSAARVVSLLTGRTGLALPPNREGLLRVMKERGASRVILNLTQAQDRAARPWLAGAPEFHLEWSHGPWEIYRLKAASGRGAPFGALWLLGRGNGPAQRSLRTGMPASQGTLVWHRPQPQPTNP